MSKILLVEDDVAIREGLMFSYEQSGHELLTAGSVKEARAIASGECLGLVLYRVRTGTVLHFTKTFWPRRRFPLFFLLPEMMKMIS